jgi:glycosyltransferase involved in cell wall biosynthesis
LRKFAIKKKNFIFSLTPHGGFNPEWRIFSKAQATIKQFYHYVIGSFLINRSVDIVRAVSDWEHDQIASKGVKKYILRTIPNGVENEAYEDIDKKASKQIKTDVKSYGKYILQIGRIYMIKNYETTIKALTKLPKDVNYVIAGPIGSVAYKEKLEKLIKELGLENRVIFAGVIRGIDKYYLIKHAQLMVHMALWESFCNVVHEA